MAEECNFHKIESNAMTSPVIFEALSFSEVTDKASRANRITLLESRCLTVENVDLNINNFNLYNKL